MKAIAKTTTTVQAHEQESVSKIGIGLIGLLSAMIGTWGVACLISGICQYGIAGMIKGWVSAVMGG
ncbi:MAG: hypothetical protein AB1545_11315 [Thermodesulfobacteriota bacterium]